MLQQKNEGGREGERERERTLSERTEIQISIWQHAPWSEDMWVDSFRIQGNQVDSAALAKNVRFFSSFFFGVS